MTYNINVSRVSNRSFCFWG